MTNTNTLPTAGSHEISLDTAIEMTGLFRNEQENILATAYQNNGILPTSETFNRDAFDKLLNMERAEGIRLYYGMDANFKVHGIFVAVDENNEDILPNSTAATGKIEEGTVIIQTGQRCPNLCPPDSPLNSEN